MDARSEPLREATLSVGAAAAHLGVAPGTLRSWGRRYGLAPEARSAGGHRRYSAADMARLDRMQNLIDGGVPPARAAALVLGAGSADLPATAAVGSAAAGAPPLGSAAGRFTAGPTVDDAGAAARSGRTARAGGRAVATRGTGTASERRAARHRAGVGAVLAVPGGSPAARGLARAAVRLDATALESVLGERLLDRGVLETWETVVRPVFRAIGERWERTGTAVEVEHLLTQATLEALQAHRRFQPRPVQGRPVLLACAPDDDHSLPMHVVGTALAEHRVPVRLLGGRVPTAALAAAAARTAAAAILVWRQMPAGPEGAAWPAGRPATRATAAAQPGPDTGTGTPAGGEAEPGSAPLTTPGMRTRPLVVAGGPGWTGVRLPPTVRRPTSLPDVVTALLPAPHGRR